MIRVTRRYEFSASHRLHSPEFTEDRNREVFGKCNNPFGHGHNYELFVTVRGLVDDVTGQAVRPEQLDSFVEREIVEMFHHRNLNVEVPPFQSLIPTTENLAVEIAGRLQREWRTAFPEGSPALDRVRIRETDRNSFELSNLS